MFQDIYVFNSFDCNTIQIQINKEIVFGLTWHGIKYKAISQHKPVSRKKSIKLLPINYSYLIYEQTTTKY